jgi:hypothetical protein
MFLADGHTINKIIMATPPIGTLIGRLAQPLPAELSLRTHFSQNIHLQVVVPVMTPPTTGPQTPASATVRPRVPTTNGRNLGGDISGHMTIVSAYNPVPPMPCSVLKMMSCVEVWAKPHANEKTVKKKKDVNIIGLRP